MNKIKFFILGLSLFLPFLSFAAINYNRTPSGFYISNPVSIDVSFDDIETNLFFCDEFEDEWTITFYKLGAPPEDGLNIADLVPRSQLSHTFVVNLPAGEYNSVMGSCVSDATGINPNVVLEGEYFGENPIFMVIDTSQFLIDGINNVSAKSMDYVGVMIFKFWPFVLGFLILIGIIYLAKRLILILFK